VAPDFAAVPFDEGAAGLTEDFVQRRRRNADRGVAWVRPEDPAENIDERLGGRTSNVLVQRRQSERLPEHFAESRPLTVTLQPLRHCFVVVDNSTQRVGRASATLLVCRPSGQPGDRLASPPERGRDLDDVETV
jgi:hypothetical protein